MTNSPTPESEATSRPEITVRSLDIGSASRSGIHDNGCCTTSKRREGERNATGLNRVQKHPSFVDGAAGGAPAAIDGYVPAPGPARRARSAGAGPRATTQAVRRFDFVPLWHIPVVFLYAMRRVSCPRCGVRVEALPWATGKHRLTDAYAWFLAERLSWQEVAAAFPTSWDTVYRAVRMAVEGPCAPRPDEHRGHRRRRAIAPPRATLPPGLSDRRPL